MKPYNIIQKAKEMDISPEAAIRMAIRYKEESIAVWMKEDCLVSCFWALQTMMDIEELRRYQPRKQPAKDEITDEMIERAKKYPIEHIIEFTRGKARCINPQHDDRNPSMYYGNRTNKAICPACGESFDAIACYQAIWGVSFKDAVKSLQ